MSKPHAPAVLDLLLLTRGLIDQATGEKKVALQRAWMNAFRHEAAAMMNLDEGRLPRHPRSAVEALIRLSLQLSKAIGMNGAELSQFYNDTTDSGALIGEHSTDDCITRGFALLGVLAAHQVETQLPSETEDERKSA